MEWLDRVWISDSETFAYDNFWGFINLTTGDLVEIHNDNFAVINFIKERKPILVGYNYRDYDQHILRACLLNWSNEGIKYINDLIISRDHDLMDVYNAFRGEHWVEIPPIIDLFPDIVNKPSLKQIEGWFGSSIEECSVPFDIDRPLTPEEIEEVFVYQRHDITETFKLWGERQGYIKNKIKLCELNDVDPFQELKHPNARVAADILQAVKTDFQNEQYKIPPTVDRTYIPKEAIAFAESLDRDKGRLTKKEAKILGIELGCMFDFYGNSTVMGVGGLHSAVGYIDQQFYKVGKKKGEPKARTAISVPYQEYSTDERVLLIQDITSFYPSLMVLYNYLSRAIPEDVRDLFSVFYNLRIKAKAEGDTETADACKLILNTVYGCMKSKHNNLADSMNATNTCVSGQLFILDVVGAVCNVESVKLIQTNTDGWIISVNRDKLSQVYEVVTAWEKRTGLSVDSEETLGIWQRDVNNYILKTENGLKVKGGTVGGYYGRDKNWELRGFKYSNTIIDRAIVDYLVNGIPLDQTIYECDDLSKFQMIIKAGKGYKATWSNCSEIDAASSGEDISFDKPPNAVVSGSLDEIRRFVEPLVRKHNPQYELGNQEQKVNRIYATTDTSRGYMLKETYAGNFARFPDTPEHAFVDNMNTAFSIDNLDREWYYNLAKKRLDAFIGKGEEMTEEQVTETAPKKVAVTRKPRVKKEEVIELTFDQRVLKFQELYAEKVKALLPESVIKHISHEYVNTHIYKEILADCAREAELKYSDDFAELNFLGVLEKTKDGTHEYGCTVKGFVILSWDGHYHTYIGYGFGMGTRGTCVAIAQTSALRAAITNGTYINTGHDDVYANSVAPEVNMKGYLNDTQKENVKAAVKEKTVASVKYVQVPIATDFYERMVEAVDVKSGVGDKSKTRFKELMAKHYAEDGTPKTEDGHLTLTHGEYITYNMKLDEFGF